jgi:hypothetical protein
VIISVNILGEFIYLFHFPREYIKADVPYHIHHKHHVTQVAEVKYIKVPVEKEVKILEPYKVPYKIKVPYIVKQEIHTVPVHKHEVHSSEHIHHAPTKSHYSHDDEKSFSSHAATNLAPKYVSHSPIQQAQTPQAYYVSSQKSLPYGIEEISAKNLQPSYTHNFNSRLHTSVIGNVGFGSHEGQALSSYEVKEPEEFGPVTFGERSSKALPYPLPQNDKYAAEYLFGFNPNDYKGYDFTSGETHY